MTVLTAPAPVRAMFRRGVAMARDGYGGAGLRRETIAWAKRLAAGEPVTLAKARLMRGWFARHGASDREANARTNSGSPASVAWLLWGGNPRVRYAARGWRDPVHAWNVRVLAHFDRSR